MDFIRDLSDRERLLLSTALINQARRERTDPINLRLEEDLSNYAMEKSAEELSHYLSRAERREDFYELFATMVQRGYIVIRSPFMINPTGD